MRRSSPNPRGSVVLVALCFTAVIGIALAGYIAVAVQAMRVSDRSFHSGTGSNFAEMGLERALQALNENTWTSWTNLSGGTLGTSADAKLSISVANNKYGTSGISGTVKVRIYHRNASNSWSTNNTYTTADMVYHRGVWFQCIAAVSAGGSAPHLDTTKWASAPSVWNPAATYTSYSTTSGDVVIYGTSAYRCIRTHANQLPTNTNFWTSVTAAAWSSSTSYAAGSLALANGTVYRSISTHSNQTPPNSTYWAGAPVIYAEGSVTLPGSSKVIRTQLRAEYSPAPLFPNAAAATTAVTFSAASVVDSYDSNIAFPYPVVAAWVAATAAKPYFVGDFALSGTTLYRCIAQHTSNFPVTNTTYWSPQGGAWASSRVYYLGETVTYSSVTYRCIQQHTSAAANAPSATSTYWAQNWLAPTASTPYYVGDIVGYLGNFYRCIQQHTTSQLPNATSSAYWAQPLGYSAAVAGGNTGGTAVTLTSARVNGYVAAPSNTASPYAPRTSLGTSAVVTGSAISTVTPTTKVDTARVTRNVYIPQFTISAPSTSGGTQLPDSNAVYTLGTSGATTPTVYYYNGNLNIADNRTYNIVGPVQIVISGYFYLGLNGGTAPLPIMTISGTPSDKAKLEMFIGGDIAIYKGGIRNDTLLPKNCVIFSTTTATAPDMRTTTPFYGVVYVPNGSFKVVGAQQLFGAYSAKNLTFSAAAMLHYDTTLRTTVFTGADTPYQITSWRELTAVSEQLTL